MPQRPGHSRSLRLSMFGAFLPACLLECACLPVWLSDVLSACLWVCLPVQLCLLFCGFVCRCDCLSVSVYLHCMQMIAINADYKFSWQVFAARSTDHPAHPVALGYPAVNDGRQTVGQGYGRPFIYQIIAFGKQNVSSVWLLHKIPGHQMATPSLHVCEEIWTDSTTF